jgi:predicted nucleotidyltransferase
MNGLSVLNEQDRLAVEEFSSAVKEILRDRLVKLILYGSKARGTGEEDSDIDILIVAMNLKGEDERGISDIAGDILVDKGILISTIIFDSRNLEWTMGDESPFVRNVLSEGIEIG